jgi:hypothetical protein
MTGNLPKSIKLESDAKKSASRPAAVGALRSLRTIEEQVDDLGVQLAFVSLDHYTSPPLGDSYSRDIGSGLPANVARALLDEAIDTLGPVFGDEVATDKGTYNRYVDYLTSDLYGEYRLDFFGAVRLAEPAWAMIDTGALPPVLNFATSKELVWAVRNVLENHDAMIEVEFSATGQSGEDVEYERLTGEALDNFARRIVLFVEYSDADAVAYEIGMVHAAAQAEKHPPDVLRLETVQRALFQARGHHIPFAQHGGTGASELAVGLVGKNNINTQYLVDAANTFADHYEANREGLRAGLKNACGTGIFLKMIAAIAGRAVEKMKEANSYGYSPELLKLSGLSPVVYEGGRDFLDIKATE